MSGMDGGMCISRGEDDRARGQRAGGASEGAGGFMDIYKIITIKEEPSANTHKNQFTTK